jgi:hypothetical protein
MAFKNKIHLVVCKNEMNNWFSHQNFPGSDNITQYELQLKGDTRLWPLFIEQIADATGCKNFMKDFDTILRYAEANRVQIFTLYDKGTRAEFKASKNI